MIVYRFEHPATGRGPYNPGRIPGRDLDVLEAHGEFWDHASCPPPFRDGLMDHISADGRLYGFRSWPELDAWFPPESRALLAQAGFQVRTYNVAPEGVEHGGRQCRFPAPDGHPCYAD